MKTIRKQENLIYILLPVMFGFMYFLLYAPVKVSDDQLLIIITVFTAFVIGIPLFAFGDFNEEQPFKSKKTYNNQTNENNQRKTDDKGNKKQEKNKKNEDNQESKKTSFSTEEDEWYKILESSLEDTDAQIKSNFRRLAKKYHPDVIQGKNLDKDFVDLATKKFKEINKAFENIKKSRKL